MALFMKNINIKNVILIIMAVVIIGFIVFRPSTDGEIDKNEEQIELLRLENKKLTEHNDSLKVNNGQLKEDMEKIYDILEVKDIELSVVKNNIKVLEGKRNEIRNFVTTMDGDDVSRTYTNYLKRRGKDDN